MSGQSTESQPRLLVLANQKGGVGKTATTLGLASAVAAQEGGNVLVVDLDPQGNATNGVGVEVADGQPTVASLFDTKARPGALVDVVVASAWDRVDVAPATEELAALDEAGNADLVWRLDAAFDGVDLSAYRAILFDTPPSLGKLLFSALLAADEVVVVTEPTVDSVKGVGKVEETIARVQRRPNRRLRFESIVVSRHRGIAEHGFRENELRGGYGTYGAGGKVCRTVIPDLAARQDAHSARLPIHGYRGGKSLSLQVAYTDLAAELGLLQRSGAAV
ncbi:ParA family protein [Nocardia gipuzkoensis]|uniref:ParA family protein n=1 Tax=Nocardia gipuzkoensis TaxID=2749991 RepID=UPI00237D6103|nr:ParA family protein [Nocardia gipuzkoensis]MDE1674698.1 ParA family protein [Nocardia gipuzkoensis]